jgi:hypothetical protein
MEAHPTGKATTMTLHLVKLPPGLGYTKAVVMIGHVGNMLHCEYDGATFNAADMAEVAETVAMKIRAQLAR